jgi:hypothetical protein
MPDLGELLRDAAPPPRQSFDVDALRRGVAERRSHRLILVVAGCVAAIVAVAGAGFAMTRDPSQTLRVTNTQPSTTSAVPSKTQAGGELRLWPLAGASGVAAGFDAAWVAGQDAPANYWVARLDRNTGEVVRRIATPGRVTQVAVGVGHVWATGNSPDSGDGTGGVTVIDPTSNRVVAAYGYQNPVVSADAIAFSDGAAWVSSGSALLRIEVQGERLIVDRVVVGGVLRGVVATSDGTLWVQSDPAPSPGPFSAPSLTGRIVRVDPRARRVADSFRWTGNLLDAAKDRIWASQVVWERSTPRTRLVELDPDRLAGGLSQALGTRTPLDAPYARYADADENGIWSGGRDGIARFSARDLAEFEAQPSRLRSGYDVRSLAGDTGVVWFVTFQGGGVYRWAPGLPAVPDPTPRP